MPAIDTQSLAFQLKRVYPRKRAPVDLFKKDARKIVKEAQGMYARIPKSIKEKS